MCVELGSRFASVGASHAIKIPQESYHRSKNARNVNTYRMQHPCCKRPKLDENKIPDRFVGNKSILSSSAFVRSSVLGVLPLDGILRIEHRSTGDEDRILLFPTNRSGIAGKIIFISGRNCALNVHHQSSCSTKEDQDMIVQAKIVSLEVKEQYRGYDLGGLLFSLAITMLSHRYNKSVVTCSLDAEEDVRRHNRLVSFYKELGCSLKVNVKATYLNSCNGDQVIRKVPMQIVLGKRDAHFDSWMLDLCQVDGNRLVPVQFSALPYRSSNPIHVDPICSTFRQSTRPLFWLFKERPDGVFQIHTTLGEVLSIDARGNLFLQATQLTSTEDELLFVLEKWCEHEMKNAGPRNDEVVKSDLLSLDDLWTIRSVSHNLYLTASCFNHSNSYPNNQTIMTCSQSPVFWSLQGKAKQVALTCTCTKETPLRQFHIRTYWSIQSVQYVSTMKQHSTNRRVTIHCALNLARDIPLKPYRKHYSPSNTDISVRTMCLAMAEAARAEDYPDWFQIIALIHELGRVCSIFDHEIHQGLTFDWTISCGARVIGYRSPNIASFSAYRNLDPEYQRFGESYSIYNRQCGLKNTLLTWTGPEFLYHLLRRNNTLLCDEALTVLRLFSLRCWHANSGEYSEIEDEDDIYMKSIVNEFDRLRRRVKKTLYDNMEYMQGAYSDTMCENLWRDYYCTLFEKYSCDGTMQW